MSFLPFKYPEGAFGSPGGFDFQKVMTNPMLSAGLSMLGGSLNHAGQPKNIGQIGMMGMGAYGQMMQQNMLFAEMKARQEERQRELEEAERQKSALAKLNDPSYTPEAKKALMAEAFPMLAGKQHFASPGAPEPLEKVMGPDGPTLVPRSQAAGMTPFTDRAAEPLVKVMGPDGVPIYAPRGQAIGKQAPVSGLNIEMGPDGQLRVSQGVGVTQQGKTVPTKTQQSKIQAEQLETQDLFNLADEALKNFNPDLQTYQGKGKEWIASTLDKLGIASEDQKALLDDATNHRAAQAQLTAIMMHKLTGAAQTESEAQRMKPFLPTAADSPTQARAKIKYLRAYFDALGERLNKASEQGVGFESIPLDYDAIERKATGKAPMLEQPTEPEPEQPGMLKGPDKPYNKMYGDPTGNIPGIGPYWVVPE